MKRRRSARFWPERATLVFNTALVGLLSLTSVVGVQAQGNVRTADWYGDYVYEHYAGKSAGGSAINFAYRLHLGDDGCRIDVEGYQTNEQLLCTARAQGKRLRVDFRSYPDGRTANAAGVRIFAVGGQVLTLIRSTRGVVTRWSGELRPPGRVPSVSLRRR